MKVSFDLILLVCCDSFGIELMQLQRKRRGSSMVGWCRFFIISLTHKYCDVSSKDIAGMIGRDHSLISYALKKVLEVRRGGAKRASGMQMTIDQMNNMLNEIEAKILRISGACPELASSKNVKHIRDDG